MTRPLVIAHRGVAGERPENTFPAFELAVAQHADMIELDLHLSRDGVIVIHHDASLARLGAKGEIADHDAAELAELDAGPGWSERLRMPTLAEVLDRFGERIELNLEVKQPRAGHYEGIEARALALVQEHGLLGRMLFSSFSGAVLERLRALSVAARLGVLVSPRARWRPLARARRVRAEALNPHVELVSTDLVRRAHSAGLRVYPYTEDDPDRMRRLLDCGVDGIITNHPARLRSLLESTHAGDRDHVAPA